MASSSRDVSRAAASVGADAAAEAVLQDSVNVPRDPASS